MEAIRFAADGLSHWVGEIACRHVAVLSADEPTQVGNPRLIVGVSVAKTLFPADMKAIGATTCGTSTARRRSR